MERLRRYGAAVGVGLLLLVAGCEEMGNVHEKPSDEPYAADPNPEPEPEPDPEAGRIDAYAHECLEIEEVIYNPDGYETTKHIWENQCSYEVIVFYCQASYTGPVLDPPAPGHIWTDRRDCGTSVRLLPTRSSSMALRSRSTTVVSTCMPRAPHTDLPGPSP